MFYLGGEGLIIYLETGYPTIWYVHVAPETQKIDELQIMNVDKEFTKPHETMDDQQ